MTLNFEITFFGHTSIRSLHTGTIEITRGSELTPSGDCVIGVSANYACADIPAALKRRLQDASTRVRIRISVNNMEFELNGRGDPAISLEHKGDIVIRKSTFVCPRTLAVECSAASDAIPREMIRALRNPDSRGTLSITV